MEKFQYSQLNLMKALLLLILISGFFIVAPILFFGLDTSANYVNSFPNKKF